MKNFRLFKDEFQSVMIDCNAIVSAHFSGDYNDFRIKTTESEYEFGLFMCFDDEKDRDKLLLKFIDEIQFLKVTDLVIDFGDREFMQKLLRS